MRANTNVALAEEVLVESRSSIVIDPGTFEMSSESPLNPETINVNYQISQLLASAESPLNPETINISYQISQLLFD